MSADGWFKPTNTVCKFGRTCFVPCYYQIDQFPNEPEQQTRANYYSVLFYFSYLRNQLAKQFFNCCKYACTILQQLVKTLAAPFFPASSPTGDNSWHCSRFCVSIAGTHTHFCGSVSHRRSTLLPGCSSEHNFRRAERDISILCKLLCRIWFQSSRGAKTLSRCLLTDIKPRRADVHRVLCLLQTPVCHSEIRFVWQLSGFH